MANSRFSFKGILFYILQLSPYWTENAEPIPVIPGPSIGASRQAGLSIENTMEFSGVDDNNQALTGFSCIAFRNMAHSLYLLGCEPLKPCLCSSINCLRGGVTSVLWGLHVESRST